MSLEVRTFASLLRKQRAFSSAGSEHLPYKQRVGGSNPSTPTLLSLYNVFSKLIIARAFSSAGSEHLPYKQRVGGSNPSTPTLNIGESLKVLLFLCLQYSFSIKQEAMRTANTHSSKLQTQKVTKLTCPSMLTYFAI